MILNQHSVIKEWNDTNSANSLDPSILTIGSNKKAQWECSKCGEKWIARISQRTKKIKPSGCPYCSNPPILASKTNNLAIMYPQIAQEFDSDKNEISPFEILPFSNQKMWFLCPNGHEYQQVIAAKTKLGQSCPQCKKSFSKIELRIYTEIRYFFRDAELRARVSGREVDILIPSLKIGIEIDGYYWHQNQLDRDIKKNIIIHKAGYTLIRMREKPLELITNYDVACDSIYKDSDVIVSRDKLLLVVSSISGKKFEPLSNMFYATEEYDSLVENLWTVHPTRSLAYRFPEVAKRWSYRNELPADEIVAFQKGLFWWKCQYNHEYQTSTSCMIAASQRGASSNGCPYCSKRKADSSNNLAKISPSLAYEWHPTLNTLTSSDVRPQSNKVVWWRCQNGHEWKEKIQTRYVLHRSCPLCHD